MSKVFNMTIELDHAGDQYTGEFYMNGWYAITSADTASLVIEDINKIQVIRGVSKITNERMIYGPHLASPTFVKNLKTQVWTNIERVIIHVARFSTT